ncbi:P-loop containing nucleoside triphosphate hydrolase protein [Irpex rosettiformis]|uniref:P-loop containing nucleoside triphosphate hydrolase protein n=1 Tax=Irpex rosettiformis TaxID=378272 RepID=A0ACB8UA84_9APHY|nr:P-loop containing nucleoside triphosphate hydrolase protein [Irpex rosettiformis]
MATSGGNRPLNMEQDTVIAVMGPTGSGKSTFINLVSGSKLPVSDSLRSCTNTVQESEIFYVSGHPVTLIDTPGFDDTIMSDTDVLKLIASYLTTTYEHGFKLSGVIYMHRITDRRVGGISKKNFGMLRKLCGDETLENVAIVTTMWDQESSEEKGTAREQELMTDPLFFKHVVDKGAQMLRHDNGSVSARNIVSRFISKSPVTLRIQKELVDENKDIGDTAAGIAVQGSLATLIEEHKREIRTLQEDMLKAMREHDLQTKQELEEERAEMEIKLKKMENDRQRLSREYLEEKAKVDAELRRLQEELYATRESRANAQKEVEDLKANTKTRRTLFSKISNIFRRPRH